jgi:orotidine-5'-phosphate decarboxylase
LVRFAGAAKTAPRAARVGRFKGEEIVDAGERLIVPLDVGNVEDARALVARLSGVVSFYKLGPWLLLARGFERLLDDLQAAGNKIFLDTKGCDIPETMRAGAAAAAARGIDFLTIHGNADVTDEAMGDRRGRAEASKDPGRRR